MARPHHHSHMPPQLAYPRWPDERAAGRSDGRRDESMGPPRELPRHRSISRLTDAWRSAGGSPMPSSSPAPYAAGGAYHQPQAYAYARGQPGLQLQQHAYHAQTPLRYVTPSLTAGPSATPGSWAHGPQRVMMDRHPSIAPGYDPFQGGAQRYYRGDSVDVYGEYAKAPSAPRSSSIGPWLRAAQGQGSRGRSTSRRSSNTGPGSSHPYQESLAHPRMYERYSPAYIRPSSSFFGSGRPVVDPYAHAAMAASSRALSELPAPCGLIPYSAAAHTPAPDQHRPQQAIGSAPSAFRGPSSRALNYIRQATESATSAGSPRRARAMPTPPAAAPSAWLPTSQLRPATPKTEPASTPAPGNLFDEVEDADDDEEQADDTAAADIAFPTQRSSPPPTPPAGGRKRKRRDERRAMARGRKAPPVDLDDMQSEGMVGEQEAAEQKGHDEEGQDEAQEVFDFDDEDESVSIIASTPVHSSPLKTPAPLKRATTQAPRRSAEAAKVLRSSQPKSTAAPPQPSAASTEQPPRRIRRLSNWYLYTQRTKKLPKEISNRMRSSPFSRVLGTDDIGQAAMWVRAAGQLEKEDVMRLVQGPDVVPTDYTWDTNLITTARLADGTDEVLSRGTIIISTSSGAEYALMGPMEISMAAERSVLDIEFWQEFEDTGGLAEEGWEALILRALLQAPGALKSSKRSKSRKSTALPVEEEPAQSQLHRNVPHEYSPSRDDLPETEALDPAQNPGSQVAKHKPRRSSTKLAKTPRRAVLERQGSKTPHTKPNAPPSSRELAGLMASPFGTLTAVRQALYELGMAASDSEDEISQDISVEVEHPYFTRRKGPEDPDPIKPSRPGGRAAGARPRLTAVTDLREFQVPGELSDASDSADEYRHIDASSDDEDGHEPRALKRRADLDDRGIALQRSKRLRTPASARKWWEVATPAHTNSKASPRVAVADANRRPASGAGGRRRKS